MQTGFHAEEATSLDMEPSLHFNSLGWQETPIVPDSEIMWLCHGGIAAGGQGESTTFSNEFILKSQIIKCYNGTARAQCLEAVRVHLAGRSACKAF